MSSPIIRTPTGLQQDIQTRLRLLERRIGKNPDRLSPSGEQTVDWNTVTAVGFYWANAGAANAPFASLPFSGVVYSRDGYVEQRLSVESALSTNEWVRRYNLGAGTWSAWRRTDGIRIPSSVVGGLFDPVSGRINLTAGSKNWQVNGVFSADKRTYEIEWGLYTGANNNTFIRLRNAGVDLTSGAYYYSLNYNVSTTPTSAAANATTWWVLAGVVSAGQHGKVEISNPATTTGSASQKRIRGLSGISAGNAPPATVLNGYAGGVDVNPYDGFTLGLQSQGGGDAGVLATSESFIIVREAA